MRVIVIASLLAMALLGLLYQAAGAADGRVRGPTTRPTSGPGSVKMGATATVAAIDGLVQLRAEASGAWRKAVVGEEVNEGTEVRVGPKSAIAFRFEGREKLVTIDRLGVSKVSEHRGLIGVPYERTRYDINQASEEHESELVSPSTTIAIRGQKVFIFPDNHPADSKASSQSATRPASAPSAR